MPNQHEETQESTNDEPMSLVSHLKELKNRIVVILVVFALGAGAAMYFAKDIVNALMAMGTSSGYKFVFIAPQELIMVYVQIAILSGLVIAMPVIAYELYKFAVPALTDNEKKAFRNAMIFGFVMFIAGVAFAYFVSLPFMLYFLINLKVDIAIEASISIQSFVSFILTVFVIFGVVFEMPVVSSLLTRLGLLKPQYLVKARKIAIVLIFLVAAIITPPDVVSQVMVAVPMILLYQFSIWISSVVSKTKHTSDESEDVIKKGENKDV